MSDSEQEISDEMPPPQIKRGRPAGKSDSTQRTRRTAQEISDDKIRVAQMKPDAIREAGERKEAEETKGGVESAKRSTCLLVFYAQRHICVGGFSSPTGKGHPLHPVAFGRQGIHHIP